MDNSVLLWGVAIILLVSLAESQGGYSKSMEPSAQLSSSNVHFHSRRGKCFFGGGDSSDDSTLGGGNYNSNSGSSPDQDFNWYRNRPVRNSAANTQPNFVHQFRSVSGNPQLSSDATYKFYPYAVAIPYSSKK